MLAVKEPPVHQGVARCYFCHNVVDAEQKSCSGCGEYICDDPDCDGNRNRNMPFGKHDVSLHSESSEDDEE